MAKITRKKLDEESAAERLILIGLIISGEFIRDIEPVFNPEFLQSDHCRTVAGWCLDYWREFGKPPGQHIQDIFEAAKRDDSIGDHAELIEALLQSASEQYEASGGFNAPYAAKRAEEFFKARSLVMLAEDVKALSSRGDTLEAEALVSKFTPVVRPSSTWVDPIRDDTAANSIFTEEDSQVLFKMPGALGQMLGPMERDNFLAICGPEKRGKTWWLLEFAMRAATSRCNTAFFSVGDMSTRQVLSRVYSYLTETSVKHAGRTIMRPVLDCLLNQNRECNKEECPHNGAEVVEYKAKARKWVMADPRDYPEHVPCTACMKSAPKEFHGRPWAQEFKVPGITPEQLERARRMYAKRIGSRALRIECKPANTVNVKAIQAYLDIWERECFVPDVIVIDYADILAPLDSRKEARHQVNDTWMALRALAQQRNCLVVSATQAKIGGHSKSRLDVEDAGSEDKRKLAHATHIIALNQTPEQKAQGIMNISELVKREDDFDVRNVTTVLQCLAIGRPYLTSYRAHHKEGV